MSIFPDHRKVSAPPLVNLISLNCIRFPSLSLTFVLLSEGMSERSEQRGIEKTFFPLRCFLMMVAMLKKLSASFSVIDTVYLHRKCAVLISVYSYHSSAIDFASINVLPLGKKDHVIPSAWFPLK